MSAIRTIPVGLAERSYDIIVGAGLLARADTWIVPLLPSKRVILVTDEAVASHYATALRQTLESKHIHVDEVRVKAGEGSKSFTGYAKLMEELLALKPDRKTTLIALGGGVVGDLTGFAASTLLRGVPYIQIPTTLLAQVDSSVGGKTAINAKAGKNLIGSFYQPRLVLADLDTLKTLPVRELRAGYAEIIKYGLIANEPFYRWCIANGDKLMSGDVASLHYAVAESCVMKSNIVGADERESDRRALLNFGHTFGHALEAETGYGDTLLHGEAVAIGMVMACRLSAQMKYLAPEVEIELARHLKTIGLPTSPRDVRRDWDVERLMSHCMSDKKAEGGTLTFVVLDAVGHARVVKQVDGELARVVLASYMKA
jgi:3-dehydroquinate synthase